MTGNQHEDPAPAEWPSPTHGWLSGSPPTESRESPRSAPPLAGGMPRSFPGRGRATDDGEGSTARARWTLALAVTGSILLLGGTVLFWRDTQTDTSGTAPMNVQPEPWQPPTVAPSDEPAPVLPDDSAAASGLPSEPTANEGDDGEDTDGDNPPAQGGGDHTTAPVTPSVTVSQGGEPPIVNLTALGSRDWVHWGLNGIALDRKSGGTGEIADLGSPTPRGRYDNNPQVFTWTGGTPTASTGPTPTGVYVCGRGTGFTLSVPASPTTRTLRVYAGVWMAVGQLTASVGGKTATATLQNTTDISTNEFVLKFRAAAGQSLRLTWTATTVFHPTCGNVDIQAATLS